MAKPPKHGPETGSEVESTLIIKKIVDNRDLSPKVIAKVSNAKDLRISLYKAPEPPKTPLQEAVDAILQADWFDSVDVRPVNSVRDQQGFVRNFLLENSPALANTPMCRTFPVFLYAAKTPNETSIKLLFWHLETPQVDAFRGLTGSWLGRFFATDREPLTLEQFWDKHRRLHKAKDVIGSLGLVGASVSLVGLMITKSAAPVQAAPPAPHQQIDAQPTPIPPPTQVTINIYGLTNNIAGLVNAKTPAEALKIIEKMQAEAHTQPQTVPSSEIVKKATKKPSQKKKTADDSAKLRRHLSGPRSGGVTLEE